MASAQCSRLDAWLSIPTRRRERDMAELYSAAYHGNAANIRKLM